MSSSHWCYRCNRFVSLRRLDILMCPECDSGFVEQMEQPTRTIHVEPRRRRFSTAATTYMIGNQNSNNNTRHRNCRNNENDISQYNPIIMLRNNGTSEGTSNNNRGVELFYEDRVGNGLRPLPRRMSELLLGSGFERIVEDLYNLEANRSGHERQHTMHLPALKSAVESLPSINIDENHMITESHCAVCKEPFELGISAREMPCKHIYHPECILPWLAIRHSCPVCRHQLPREPNHDDDVGFLLNEEENIGFTIWRLPGGEFAVGRFSGGRRGGRGGDGDGGGGGGEGENEEDAPVIYNVGEPRRVSWSLSSSTTTSTNRVNGGSFRRLLNSLIGCLRGGRVVGDDNPHSHSEESQHVILTPSPRNNVNNNTSTTPSPRSRSRTWSMDVNSGTRSW